MRLQEETFEPLEKFNLFKFNLILGSPVNRFLLHIYSLRTANPCVVYVALHRIFGGLPCSLPIGDKGGDGTQV